MYLGVDLGTSGIKVILMLDNGKVLDTESYDLSVSRPQPLWSEQDPNHWWHGLDSCMTSLSERQDLSRVLAMGLSGQMHGATLLGAQNQVLRPAILWNDGRSEAQCQELEALVPDSRTITGNVMMTGFTAPKLLWIKQQEPDLFSLIAKVLLPKDFLRFLLTGDFASDMSDSAGTGWLDVGKRDWSERLLEACDLNRSQMPKLFESNQVTGYVKLEHARRWGMSSVPVIAGAGDNAAGAMGVGLTQSGQAMISLGTSGVYFLVTDGFTANPDRAVHSFCHALPDRWHLMSVLLSAASCLQWFADNIVQKEVAELLDELGAAQVNKKSAPLFLPYLSGERTPHNNPHAKGNFFGLTHSNDRASLTHSILEGVSFAFADGVDALHESGKAAQEINLIGGGAKSQYWRQMLADVLGKKIIYRAGSEVGPAIGAARLAQLAMQPERPIEQVCPVPQIEQVHTPDPQCFELYQKRRQRFQSLYQRLHDLC
ncbi:xylulokinase [Aliiglaciecola sp. M165]|uniref:xylulokinase n=1 Tax=Aliiglaciecola sp. M165 TaxID=2593649 RepID=UPI00117E3FED|nr:xylulokinase [Aliiglaciecola sp. M165]TRY31771.1 xylulokinase [Aliiglaciecola sp. M165]